MTDSNTVLNIALIQTDIYWEDITANLSALEEKILGSEESFDMLVLPEMFNTGFTMNVSVAEVANAKTTVWMKFIANHTNALVIGSIPIRDGAKVYNRILCVYPDGAIEYYNKRHLFRMGGEDKVYTGGNDRLILNYKGWRICPLICYDLRFPVWSRNVHHEPYDILIYVANWPAPRSYAWNTLLRARAIENQCYVIGVNRVGLDGNGLSYSGDTLLLDYLGEPLFMAGAAETMKVISINKTSFLKYKESFPAWADADSFDIRKD